MREAIRIARQLATHMGLKARAAEPDPDVTARLVELNHPSFLIIFHIPATTGAALTQFADSQAAVAVKERAREMQGRPPDIADRLLYGAAWIDGFSMGHAFALRHGDLREEEGLS